MGLAAPAMAQDVNYKDALKPIETTLKAGNVDAKAFAKTLKEYQKEYKKDPKALVALGNALVNGNFKWQGVSAMGRKTRLGYLIMLGADSIALAVSRPGSS